MDFVLYFIIIPLIIFGSLAFAFFLYDQRIVEPTEIP